MKRKLSIIKILGTDYVSFISWLAPLLFFFAYFLSQNRYSVAAGNLLCLSIGCTGVGLMLILWRIWMFYSILDHGTFVEGQIRNVLFYRIRGTITYTYMYRNHQYSKNMMIHMVLHNFPFQIGESITIVVDPENPDRSFILDFYEKSINEE